MSEGKKMSLTVKVLLGMALGIIVGLVINLTGMMTPGGFVDQYIVNGLFHVVGKMFVNALKMLVVPLVLFSLICGVCGIGDIRMLGRVGGKSFALYMMTTAIAIATAIGIAVTFGIGKGMDQAAEASFTGKESPPLSQVLIDIIPSNPISAMANGDIRKRNHDEDGNHCDVGCSIRGFCTDCQGRGNAGFGFVGIAGWLRWCTCWGIDVSLVHYLDDRAKSVLRFKPCDVS